MPEHLSHTIDGRQQSGNTCVYTWEVNTAVFQLLISVGANSSLPPFAAAAGASSLLSHPHRKRLACSEFTSIPVPWGSAQILNLSKKSKNQPCISFFFPWVTVKVLYLRHSSWRMAPFRVLHNWCLNVQKQPLNFAAGPGGAKLKGLQTCFPYQLLTIWVLHEHTIISLS